MDDEINDVSELIKQKHLDILCVTETKRKVRGGAIKRGSFDTYWSGVDQNQQGCRGVGFILSERLYEFVNGYKCVSSRLPWLQDKNELLRIFIFSVYASDMSKSLEEREEFWADVREILVKCDKSERLVILGYFNGWVVVQVDGYEKALSKFGDERENENGDSLLLLLLLLDTVTKFVLIDEAQQVCGVNKRANVSKKHIKWWNFEVRKVVSKKKKAWLDFLSAKANDRAQRKDILKDKLNYAERYSCADDNVTTTDAMKTLKRIKVGKAARYEWFVRDTEGRWGYNGKPVVLAL
ncbi:hypothetical protein EVAR_90964_1 [Eumeta japonica]|uniref:Craniofacial development protein 2 n=1 Tax=Eumeta variegata TaxID=151549 RepID=A0A4C1Z3Z5_EUMVA|nr:hypothetical protein EVAR_90964_1 [Eumeta japonica]